MSARELLFFAIKTSIILLGCNALDAEKIVGGDIAPAGTYPYHVAVFKNGINVCGGGLIGGYYVLTAAHCVADDDGNIHNERFHVEGGTTDLRSFPESRQKSYARVAYIPSRYTRFQGHLNDIAILKLVQRLDFGPGSFLRLPTEGVMIGGEYATITGYGWNEIQKTRRTIDGKSDDKLRSAQVKLFTRDECRAIWKNAEIPDSQMCGQVIQRDPENPEGICSGDSGGPLVTNDNVIVGVANRSPPICNEDKRPAMYAKVSTFLRFIDWAVQDYRHSSIKSVELRIPVVDAGVFKDLLSVFDI